MWEILETSIDFVLHLNKHLDELIRASGPWMYLILFLVIFAETGLVIFPFLPGDSLLFALGTFAALGSLDLGLLIVLLTIAAILGDTANYWIGAWLQPKIFRGENVRFLNKKHLERTREFFERYGGKTIIIARFVPIVRTFAPFVAGMGSMTYRRFMTYNVVGALLWINLLLGAGYLFGELEAVQNNFSLVILAIIFVSVLPGVFEFWRERSRIHRNPPPVEPPPAA